MVFYDEVVMVLYDAVAIGIGAAIDAVATRSGVAMHAVAMGDAYVVAELWQCRHTPPAPFPTEVQRGNSYSCRADDYDDVDDVVQIIFEKSIKKTQPNPNPPNPPFGRRTGSNLSGLNAPPTHQDRTFEGPVSLG